MTTVTWNLIHDEVIDNGGRINYPTLCFKFRGTSFEKNLPYAVRINYSDVHVLVRVLSCVLMGNMAVQI